MTAMIKGTEGRSKDYFVTMKYSLLVNQYSVI